VVLLDSSRRLACGDETSEDEGRVVNTFASQEQERDRREKQTAADITEARKQQIAALDGLEPVCESDRPGHAAGIKDCNVEQYSSLKLLLEHLFDLPDLLFNFASVLFGFALSL
jgi:hypothetical protein